MKTVFKKVILSLKGRIQILLEEQTSVKTENLLPLMYLNLTTSIKIKINEMKFYQQTHLPSITTLHAEHKSCHRFIRTSCL